MKDIHDLLFAVAVGLVSMTWAAVGILLFLAFAFAHSFYSLECCGDGDCHPVPAEDVIETEKGWKHLPTGTEFTKDMARPSQDRNFHVCIGNKDWNRGKPYCVYILQGT